MTTAIVILCTCLLFEAFFSGAELALISADKVRLRHLGEQTDGRRGRAIIRFLEDPGELITTSLTGTNICVVLSTVTATVTLLRYYPNQAELLSLAIMTPLVLIFGEIVPKSVFQHFADRLAPRLIYILSLVRLVFLPVVVLGGKLSAALMSILRIERQGTAMSRDELRLLIKLPSRPGADRITVDEQRMISNVFDMQETEVEHVMVPLSEVTALPETATLHDVSEEIADKGHTRLPLYRDRVDQIVGIVHAFDVLRVVDEHVALKDLARAPLFVPENQPAADTLIMMQREGQHMVVVVDEFGGAVGVVTIEDVLEEIVGEIRDEYDEEEGLGLIRLEKGGVYRVKGRTEVSELVEQTGMTLPDSDEYETIAGLVLDKLKRIPKTGESLEVSQVTIEIVGATDRSVDEVLVKPHKKPRTTGRMKRTRR